MPADLGPEAGSGWPGLLMSCLKGPHVILKMEAMKIVHPEKLPERQAAPRFPPVPRPSQALAPKRAWPCDTEIIVNQACGGDVPALEGVPRTPPLPHRPRQGSIEPGFPRGPPTDEVIVNQYVGAPSGPGPTSSTEPLECPTCGHTYNATQRRPRVLSCLHSVCEQCLQTLYESCPKYKFISCPTCLRETVLFTDYGLAALAVNTSLLSRLPPEALAAPSGGPWGGEPEGSCYQTFRQYCGAACACHARNPLSACSIM